LSTQYLLDPWFIQLKPTDNTAQQYSRLNAWSKVQELSQKFGLNPVQFIDDEFLRTFQGDYENYQRADGNFIGATIASLVIQERHDGIAEISDTPCPDLPTDWRNALHYQARDSSAPNWRRPYIVISESRSEEWPQASEIRLKTSTNNQIIGRNLVQIEKFDQHDYCEPDLDPWRLGAVGTPAEDATRAVCEQHLSRRRLPRPLGLLPLRYSFDQIVKTLQQHMGWSCGENGRAYYIPPQGWDPRTISREDWRHGNIFRSDSVQGGRRGPVDRDGRIWLWDQLHKNHWDVQWPNGDYTNVSHDGKIL
jgi:hypothetical protein